MQGLNPKPSRLHSKVAASLALKAKLGLWSGSCPDALEGEMVVSGAVTSVVMSSDQPRVSPPISPAAKSTIESFQVPLGSVPRNAWVRQLAWGLASPGPGLQ